MAISNSQNTLCCCDGSISNNSNPILPRCAPTWGLLREATMESTCPFLHPIVPISSWSQEAMKLILGWGYESTTLPSLLLSVYSFSPPSEFLYVVWPVLVCGVSSSQTDDTMQLSSSSSSSSSVYLKSNCNSKGFSSRSSGSFSPLILNGKVKCLDQNIMSKERTCCSLMYPPSLPQ